MFPGSTFKIEVWPSGTYKKPVGRKDWDLDKVELVNDNSQNTLTTDPSSLVIDKAASSDG